MLHPTDVQMLFSLLPVIWTAALNCIQRQSSRKERALKRNSTSESSLIAKCALPQDLGRKLSEGGKQSKITEAGWLSKYLIKKKNI